MTITLGSRQQELQKRTIHPHEWGQKQNEQWDALTDFVYHIFSFDALLKELEARFGRESFYKEMLNYGMNRWYNFWSAKAVEQIFCTHPSVKGSRDVGDRLRDFRIGDLSFDHKISAYPRGFNHDLTYGQNHSRELIEWFYTHQSQQRRKHYENRIFIVLYASDGEHWKLKAELSWLETLINAYLDAFDPSALFRYSFESKRETVAAIIWGIR